MRGVCVCVSILNRHFTMRAFGKVSVILFVFNIIHSGTIKRFTMKNVATSIMPHPRHAPHYFTLKQREHHFRRGSQLIYVAGEFWQCASDHASSRRINSNAFCIQRGSFVWMQNTRGTL